MDAFSNYRNQLINKNKAQFSEFRNIKWLNAYEAADAQILRDRLTEKLGNNRLFKQTKPFYRQISKGCQICGEGKWSCLFITGKCNAGCFYCPSPQLADELPGTQNFTFTTPESYAEYLNFFKFKGASFSGGEPLLYFDRALAYLQQIRKDCPPDLYVWMYTNGILADENKFRELAAAGLNEIRFDIGATNYKLDKVITAMGLIENITVEIPAVPEEKEQIKQLLPEMIAAGVTNLNLHQLRLTKHNAPKLLKRDYTYIHAEQPIVLESELAALEIINYAQEKNLEIGINYCSFYFKNRFQKAGFRKIVAKAMGKSNDEITERGFIREKNGDSIAYKALVLSDKTSPPPNYTELKLQHKTFYLKNETAMPTVFLDAKLAPAVEKLLAAPNAEIPENQVLFDIWEKEYIESGLREY